MRNAFPVRLPVILYLFGTYKLNYTELTEDIVSATKWLGDLDK